MKSNNYGSVFLYFVTVIHVIYIKIIPQKGEIVNRAI